MGSVLAQLRRRFRPSPLLRLASIDGPVGSSPLPSHACRAPAALANQAVVTETGLTHWPSCNCCRQVPASSFSPAVPPTCHKQRTPAVSSGQPRSLEKTVGLRARALTCGGGGGRNCMACKGSGVQIPSAPPGTTHLLPPR